MVYKKRLDGRKFDELRETKAEVGVIDNADGSAYFQIGNTHAYAAVYGPKKLFIRSLQDPTKGIIRCKYNMMPFSGAGGRVRPGGNRRSKEISMVTENVFNDLIDLSEYPNAVVEVYIELPQTDAGSRCCGICAASLALADAGIPMKSLVSAVAVGLVDKKVVVDLTYEEEHYPEFAKEKITSEDVADIPLAFIPGSDKIFLLQMDGKINKKELIEGLEKGKEAADKIFNIQVEALKTKYNVEED